MNTGYAALADESGVLAFSQICYLPSMVVNAIGGTDQIRVTLWFAFLVLLIALAIFFSSLLLFRRTRPDQILNSTS